MDQATGLLLPEPSAAVMFQWLRGSGSKLLVPAGWDAIILPACRTVVSAFPGVPLTHVHAGSILFIPANTCTSVTFGARHDAAILLFHPVLRSDCNALLEPSGRRVPETAMVVQHAQTCAARLGLQLLFELPEPSCPGDLSDLGEILLCSLSANDTTDALRSMSVAGRQMTQADLRLIDRLIEDNLESPIRLDDLARAAGMTSFNFMRCFKRTTGMSPLRYVLTRRMERACLVLGDAKAGIAEAAYASGFSSQSHMTTMFRRFFGITPGAYRRQKLARLPPLRKASMARR